MLNTFMDKKLSNHVGINSKYRLTVSISVLASQNAGHTRPSAFSQSGLCCTWLIYCSSSPYTSQKAAKALSILSSSFSQTQTSTFSIRLRTSSPSRYQTLFIQHYLLLNSVTMSDIGARPAEVPFTAKGNPSGGKRKISARLLTPLNSGSYNSLSSSPSSASSASLRLKDFISPSSAKDFELPTNQESVAALEFIGFTQAAAQEIYQRWEARPNPEQYPYSFLEHATGQFLNRNQGDMSHADFMTVSQNLGGISFFENFGGSN